MYVLCRDLKGNKEFAILMSTGKSFHQWRVSNGKELVTFILPGIPRIDEYIISISFLKKSSRYLCNHGFLLVIGHFHALNLTSDNDTVLLFFFLCSTLPYSATVYVLPMVILVHWTDGGILVAYFSWDNVSFGTSLVKLLECSVGKDVFLPFNFKQQ